jgi:hypothetical protein
MSAAISWLRTDTTGLLVLCLAAIAILLILIRVKLEFTGGIVGPTLAGTD